MQLATPSLFEKVVFVVGAFVKGREQAQLDQLLVVTGGVGPLQRIQQDLDLLFIFACFETINERFYDFEEELAGERLEMDSLTREIIQVMAQL